MNYVTPTFIVHHTNLTEINLPSTENEVFFSVSVFWWKQIVSWIESAMSHQWVCLSTWLFEISGGESSSNIYLAVKHALKIKADWFYITVLRCFCRVSLVIHLRHCPHEWKDCYQCARLWMAMAFCSMSLKLHCKCNFDFFKLWNKAKLCIFTVEAFGSFPAEGFI